MKTNQLTRGQIRRVMYIENKDGDIDGYKACIGWVSFSHTGLTVYYRGRTLKRSKGRGILGNYYDEATGEEYWVSGVKSRGSNKLYDVVDIVAIDPDAHEEYLRLRGGN